MKPAMKAPLSLEAWRAAGRSFRYREHEIFYRDEGAGQPLLLIHGFPTASWDWRTVWPGLIQHFRCIALDMLGFGFSAKPFEYSYSIADQASLQESLLRHLAIERYHLMSHDYGDTVAQELLARDRGERIRALCLLNGGLFPETHRPVLAQRMLAGPFGALFARLVGQSAMNRNFRRIFGPNTQPGAEDLAGFWALIETGNGRRVFPKLIRYMHERQVHRERWVGALRDTRVPLQVIVGMADPISGAHMAARCRELLPGAKLVTLDGVGHYPQVESPIAVGDAARAFFSNPGGVRE